MIGEGIEDFGRCEDMETDEKDVVGEQHESTKLIGKSAFSKDMISEITFTG